MPRSARSTVVSFGEILIDLIATDGARALEDVGLMAVRPGGAPANAAVAVSKMGLPSRFCGVVGDDPFGVRLRQTLRSHGVDDCALRTAAGAATTIAFAWQDENGAGHFRLQRDADILLNEEDVKKALVPDAAAIILGSVALSADPAKSALLGAVNAAVDAGVAVVFDVNMRPTIWPSEEAARLACQPVLERANLIKLSVDDARVLLNGLDDPGGILHAIGDYSAKFAILTDGARGAWFLNGSRIVHVPAFAIQLIDPTGAGDAFTGAMLSRLILNDWQEITKEDVTFAAAAGALTATRHGGIDALPRTDEVESFVALRT